jgi:hypothetical protein
MKHPDPEYRKIGELRHFWMKLVVGKVSLFAGSFALLILLSYLQNCGMIGAAGTYAMLGLAVTGFIALCAWDFWPSKRCPGCHAKMKKCRIRPTNLSPPSEEAMILCCRQCKTYIDLQVSTE